MVVLSNITSPKSTSIHNISVCIASGIDMVYA